MVPPKFERLLFPLTINARNGTAFRPFISRMSFDASNEVASSLWQLSLLRLDRSLLVLSLILIDNTYKLLEFLPKVKSKRVFSIGLSSLEKG